MLQRHRYKLEYNCYNIGMEEIPVIEEGFVAVLIVVIA